MVIGSWGWRPYFGALGGGVVAYSEESFPLEGVNDEIVLVWRLDPGFGEDSNVRP